MKVLHILHELYPSGAEMMIKNAYPYWSAKTEGTIMSTGNILGPFADTLRETGYEVVHVPTVGSGKKAKLKHLWSFFKYMRSHSYDVVHIHRESLAFEYAVICKLTGNKRICRTVHSTFAHTGVQRLIKSATRKLMSRWMGVCFIAISDGVAENEKKVFGISCNEVIYWCNNKEFGFIPVTEKNIAKRELLGKSDTELCMKSSKILSIVTVGTCADVKNHSLLLRAIALMNKKEQIHYFHVGYAEGETEAEHKLADDLRIAKQPSSVGRAQPKALALRLWRQSLQACRCCWQMCGGLMSLREKTCAMWTTLSRHRSSLQRSWMSMWTGYVKESLSRRSPRVRELPSCMTSVGRWKNMLKYIGR